MLTYSDIDEALSPISLLVQSIVELGEEASVSNPEFNIYTENIELDMPIEMDVLVGEEEEVILGSGTPTQSIETSFMPVFHQIKLKITREGQNE